MNMIVAWASNEVKLKIRDASLGRNAEEEVRRISQTVETSGMLWRSWATSGGGSILTDGLGEGKVEVPAVLLGDLSPIHRQYADAIDAAVGVGVGATVEEADKALASALKSPQSKVVLYADDIEQELKDEGAKSELAGLVERTLNKNEYYPPAVPYSAAELDAGDHWTNGIIKIPKADNPKREVYDKNYHKALVSYFGDMHDLKPVTLPISDLTSGHHFNPKFDQRGRYPMYSEMAKKDRLTPVVVRKDGNKYTVVDGNSRHLAAIHAGLTEMQAYELVPKGSQLEKSWKHAAAAMGVGAAIGAGFGAQRPAVDTMPVVPSHTIQSKPSEPASFASEPLVVTKEEAPEKWSAKGLAHEMHPIAHLESSFGKNVQHAAHSKGAFHTAVGAVGLKPVTAHEEYIKRAAELRQDYPGLEDPEAFTKTFVNDPMFYNRIASAHFGYLKGKAGGSLAGAAYSWRHGLGAYKSLHTDPAQRATLAAADPYVKSYLDRFKTSGAYKVNSPVMTKEVFQKAEGEGGGTTGPARPAAAAAPMKARVEGSEHTQGEAIQSMVNKETPTPQEKTHAAKDGEDLEAFLHSNAQAQGQQEQGVAQADEQTRADEELKAQVVKVLEKFKGQAGAMEKLKASNPKLYATMMEVLQSMMGMARGMSGQPEGEAPVQKSEEDLAKMALADIPVGPEADPAQVKGNGKKANDYSDLLPAHVRDNVRLFVVHDGNKGVSSVAYDVVKKKAAGVVSGNVNNGVLDVGGSELEPQYRGQGIGTAMYEALMAHSKNAHQAKTISGDAHSSMASAVHQKLSKKHGMAYKPRPNVGKGRSYESKEDFDYGPDEPYDDKYREYSYDLKSEETMAKAIEVEGEALEKMAIADLGRGRPAGTDKSDPNLPMKRFNYTHILPIVHKAQKKLSLIVEQSENRKFITAKLMNSERPSHYWDDSGRETGHAGFVDAEVLHNGSLKVHHSRLHDDYRGSGLGKAMYEAVYAHSLNRLGVNKVEGEEHSSQAAAVHAAIAQKHGLDYLPKPTNKRFDPIKNKSQETNRYDDAYEPYEYELKAEEEMAKMAIADIKPSKMSGKQQKAGPSLKVGHYDYSHVLPEDFKDQLSLQIRHFRHATNGDYLFATLHHKDNPESPPVGVVRGMVVDTNWPNKPAIPAIEPHADPLHESYRNKGLGKAMYEALYAHAFHKLKVRKVSGGHHTPAAHRVHESLAAKHGLQIVGGGPARPSAGDVFTRKNYSYDLKSEAGMTKSSNWHTPSLEEEGEELGRVSAEHNIPQNALMQTARAGKLAPLDEKTWAALENTDSYGHLSEADVEKAGKMYGRDHKRILDGMKAGASMPAPIVYHREGQAPTLVSGNTRLMAARALKIPVSAYHIGNMTKSEDLEKMAIADLGRGRAVKATAEGEQRVSYNHLLSPLHRAAGYRLHVSHFDTGAVAATLFDKNWEEAGSIDGRVDPIDPEKGFMLRFARVKQAHQNKGLGKKLYEAVYAHLKNRAGVSEVYGGKHSTMAARAHMSVAKEHGLDYRPVPNKRSDDPLGGKITRGDTGGPFDEKYKPYRYELKAEEPMAKDIRMPTVVKPAPTHHPVRLPSGSHKDGAAADSHPSRRSGQIKVTENGSDRWRQVRAGIVKNPQTGEAVSSRTVPKSDKQPDGGGE